jgi:hypothetical protein
MTKNKIIYDKCNFCGKEMKSYYVGSYDLHSCNGCFNRMMEYISKEFPAFYKELKSNEEAIRKLTERSKNISIQLKENLKIRLDKLNPAQTKK